MSVNLNKKQSGIALVEFALTAPILFLLLFGTIEFSRILYTMNLASEATRQGARVATVCNMNATGIKDEMRTRMANLTNANITVTYADENGSTNCTQDTCATVTVGIQNFTVQTFIPFFPLNFTLPNFSTTLPRESLTNGSGNDVNDLCV